MEQEEAKVDVEETSINLGCIKQELDEGEYGFDENQYKITLTFDNLFGESSKGLKDNKDSMIGFLDDEVIMEIGCIKLEDVKDEGDLIREVMEQSNFEVTQCRYCKVWLEKQEHFERHMLHCLRNYNTSRCSLQHFRPIKMEDVGESHRNDEISTPTDRSARDLSEFGIIQSKRLYEISGQTHLKRHNEENMVTIRPNMKEMKHKCSKYSYQTNYKSIHLKRHPNIYNGVKSFQCDVCKKKFTRKGSVKKHIKDQHSSTMEKEYKCSECSFQTNYKDSLKMHSITHSGIKPFECGVCEKKFTVKSNLKMHIKNQHSSAIEKKYKCSECSYQTNNKNDLKKHSVTHSGIQCFECDVCKKKFNRKDNLRKHIKNQHSTTMEKEYKCSECSYQTNYQQALSTHTLMHSGIKPFECGVCKKKFTAKGHLKMHIKDLHSSTMEKEYKCSECSYQTNYKRNLGRHSITHSVIKPFECDVCKKKFIKKRYLKTHIKNLHSSTMEKEYKCS